MESFNYTIKDPEGIHARPATVLVQACKKFDCVINIAKGDTKVDAKRIFGIMGLGAKKGDVIVLSFVGDDEKDAFCKIKGIVEENF